MPRKIKKGKEAAHRNVKEICQEKHEKDVFEKCAEIGDHCRILRPFAQKWKPQKSIARKARKPKVLMTISPPVKPLYTAGVLLASVSITHVEEANCQGVLKAAGALPALSTGCE